MHDCIVGLGVASGDVVDAAFAVGAVNRRRNVSEQSSVERELKERLSENCSVEVPTCQLAHRLVCLAYQKLGLPPVASYQVP